MNTESNKAAAVMVGVKEREASTICIDAPVFILFAEFLGYVSVFNKIAEDWCDGKVPDMHVQKVLIVEAKCIFRQMKKDYTMEDIREFYTMYHPLILQEYEDKLANLVTDETTVKTI